MQLGLHTKQVFTNLTVYNLNQTLIPVLLNFCINMKGQLCRQRVPVEDLWVYVILELPLISYENAARVDCSCSDCSDYSDHIVTIVRGGQ